MPEISDLEDDEEFQGGIFTISQKGRTIFEGMPTPEEFLMEFLAYFQAVRLVDNSTANQSIVRKFLEEKSK